MLDIACGTGLNLAALRCGVGEHGRVIGVDLSPEMLEIARGHVEYEGWQNVQLIRAAIHEATLPAGVDAALFSFAHDVLQDASAIDHVLASLRPGAVVVAAGAMTPWLPEALGKPIAALGAQRYSTTPETLVRPWRLLAGRVKLERICRPAVYRRRYLPAASRNAVVAVVVVKPRFHRGVSIGLPPGLPCLARKSGRALVWTAASIEMRHSVAGSGQRVGKAAARWAEGSWRSLRPRFC